MTRVELRDATGSLSEYVSSSPTFRRIVERSRKDYEARGGVSLEQIERQFALPPRPGKPARKTRQSK